MCTRAPKSRSDSSLQEHNIQSDFPLKRKILHLKFEGGGIHWLQNIHKPWKHIFMNYETKKRSERACQSWFLFDIESWRKLILFWYWVFKKLILFLFWSKGSWKSARERHYNCSSFGNENCRQNDKKVNFSVGFELNIAIGTTDSRFKQ